MKLHHLLVVAILGGFFVFTFAVGCSNSPTEAQFTQGEDGSWTTGDEDLEITKKKAVKKKTKRKATRVYKGRVKKKAAVKKKTGKGIGHVTYRKKRAVKKTTQTPPGEIVDYDAPFTFGVIVQDVKGVINATLNIGHPDDVESWRIAYLYMSDDYENGTDADSRGLLMKGVLTQGDLNQAEISVMELAEYLAMGEVFINVATNEYPGGEIAGALMEVDMTPLMKKVEKK